MRGSIDFRNGKWRLRIRFPTGKRKTIGYYETRDEAERMRVATLLELAGTELDPMLRSSTLGAYGVLWLERREVTHRDGDGDRQRWNAYVAGTALAARAITSITAVDVRRWVKSLLETPSERTGELRDKKTVRNALQTLRACLADAVATETLETNPAAEVRVPRGAVEQETSVDEEVVFLELDEVLAVLERPLTGAARTAFLLGLFTGLRAGELHGLRWGDVRVDADRPEIVVRRSRRDATKGGKVGAVPLLPPARTALRLWLLATGAARDDDDAPKPHELVFPADGGGPHARGYDWGWADATGRKGGRKRRGIASRAGVREEVTWHAATRHSCAVHLLFGSWAPHYAPRPLRLEEVSRWLRHASVDITHRHYARFTSDALHSIVTGSRAGSRGSPVVKILSHLGDLNPGPTVYESGQNASIDALLDEDGTRGALARRVLDFAAAGDPRMHAAAIELAERVLAESADSVSHSRSGAR